MIWDASRELIAVVATTAPPAMESARSELSPGIERLLVSRRQPLQGEDVPVKTDDRVSLSVPVDLGQVPDGAARSDQQPAIRDGRNGRVAEDGPHVLPEMLYLRLLRGIAGEELVADPQRAQRKGPRSLKLPVAEQGELDASATHVHQQPVVYGSASNRTEERVPRLGLPVDDDDPDSRFQGRSSDQLVRVRRLPDRRRGHGRHLGRARAVGDGHEVPKGFDGMVDGPLRELRPMAQVSG
jgi:hypothetical protein